MTITTNTTNTTTMSSPSSISAAALMLATPHDKAMLLDIHERRSHWWKSLHAFRKQLGLLLAELEAAKKAEREAKLQARLRYWDEKFIHQWY
jgi:ribonuclease MRP protein subunit RMP1